MKSGARVIKIHRAPLNLSKRKGADRVRALIVKVADVQWCQGGGHFLVSGFTRSVCRLGLKDFRGGASSDAVGVLPWLPMLPPNKEPERNPEGMRPRLPLPIPELPETRNIITAITAFG